MVYLNGYNLKSFLKMLLVALFILGVGITILPIAVTLVSVVLLFIFGIWGINKLITYFSNKIFKIKKRANCKSNSFSKTNKGVVVEIVTVDTSYDGEVIDVEYK
ncbi:hypothetical protein CLTEP_07630 [Clostridium tepidiprofundi DSM 19306]|uniref:Uncharacterized protein n=1 Tax=Clostridium tepidiprofundi DSM 19306 TaxID=1121338 RepID=A0A151B640_9CLOT|nr:hypothetical protein [Clostridium tepidiprofundi]KYH35359.1 hypothetical protein CLTEP_07630 [Clostridium tepidiprofundi DSM 19306]